MIYYLQEGTKFDKSNAWPTCGGVIKATHKQADDSTYASYVYAVQGKTYTEQKIFFDQNSSGAILPAKTDGYPVGQKVKVFYNPAKPDDAFLRPQVAKKTEVSRFWSLLVFFGVALISNGLKGTVFRHKLLGYSADSSVVLRGRTRRSKVES